MLGLSRKSAGGNDVWQEIMILRYLGHRGDLDIRMR